MPFHVGELLTYDVSYSEVVSVTAATATLAVKERRPVNGGSAYYMMAEAKPGSMLSAVYPLYYKLDTLLNAATMQPIQASTFSSEKGRTRSQTTAFTSPTTIDYQIKTATLVEEKKTVAPHTLDPLALIYVMRMLPLSMTMNVPPIPMTEGGDSYKFVIKVAAREDVKTGAGTFPAWRITTTILDAKGQRVNDRKLTLWVSDDARRLPLKFDAEMSIGKFVLSLNRIG